MKTQARPLSIRAQIRQFASMAAWITAIVVVTIAWRAGSILQQREMASVPVAPAAVESDKLP